MKRDLLPETAFIDPNGENSDEVKNLINEVVNLVLRNSSDANQHPVLPKAEEYGLNEFSSNGLTTEELIDELRGILRKSMNPLASSYIGHMDSIPTLISCLGEFVSTSLNNNLLSLEMSPVFSQMEGKVLKLIARLFGYDENSGGVMTSGGSLANLQALAVARNHKLKVKEEGLMGLNLKPILFVSEVSHTSIHKAASVLGLGSSNVVSVKCNQNSQMELFDLEKKINQAKNEGKNPFAVVATAGTTVTGNIDPIEAISEITNRHDLWLHVDAAYGGALAFSESYRNRLSGIEKADSITFNPQKWMYVAKTCAMVLFKERALLETEFRISAPYMNETDFTNLGEISIQGTRHADILKLYLSIQHIGLKGYDQLVKESYKLAGKFLEEVKKRPYLELASQPQTNLCCFRGVPSYWDEEKCDKWNLELQQYLLHKENIFLSLPNYRGKRWLRAVLLNPFTTDSMVEGLFARMDEFHLNFQR